MRLYTTLNVFGQSQSMRQSIPKQRAIAQTIAPGQDRGGKNDGLRRARFDSSVFPPSLFLLWCNVKRWASCAVSQSQYGCDRSIPFLPPSTSQADRRGPRDKAVATAQSKGTCMCVYHHYSPPTGRIAPSRAYMSTPRYAIRSSLLTRILPPPQHPLLSLFSRKQTHAAIHPPTLLFQNKCAK